MKGGGPSCSPRKSSPGCGKHRGRQAEVRIEAGELWQEHGLIVTSEVGTPVDPDNFSHAFSRLCMSAGLGRWHPHELRHSGASLMLAQGTPLHVVSEVLGHASMRSPRTCMGTWSKGQTGRRRGDDRSAVWCLDQTPWLPAWLPGHKKSRSASGEGPVTWRARRDSNP